MISSLCSHRTPQQKFCGAFTKATASPFSRPQAHRRFLCELSFAPFWSKESGVTAYALRNRCKLRKNIKKSYLRWKMYLLHTYGFINTQGGAPLFLFASRGTKRKSSRKRKMPFWGVSLVATSNKGYAPLTGTAWPAGACGLLCEHTDKQQFIIGF